MFVLRSHQLDGEAVPHVSPALPATTSETTGFAGHHVDVSELFERHNWLAEGEPFHDRRVARRSSVRANPLHNMPMLPPFAATFAVRFGGTKAATECPKHMTDTQALIDRVSDRMARDEDRMHHEVADLIHALLEDARMMLTAARQNHEGARGPFDHARAFAKTDTALGHARAAEILLSSCSQPHRPPARR